MGLLLNYQWEIFIALEIISVLSLLIFGVIRYFFNKQKLSLLFLLLFIILLILEALLGLLIYQETGEISTFLIIISLFVIYACTFGIFDFMKLDRWMRHKIGGWRGIQLLTEKDIRIMDRQKDPKFTAKKYRRSSTVHLIVFVTVQAACWIYGTGATSELLYYLKDLSWIGTENVAETPYANDTIYGISMIWGLIFIIDFIWSWSYTVFPAKKED